MPGPSMDSIKKKIMSMVNEKDQAVERADQFEQRAAELEEAIKSVCLLTNKNLKKPLFCLIFFFFFIYI